MCDCDYRDDPGFEETLNDIIRDAIFDGLTQDEFIEMAREMWALVSKQIEAARNAPRSPPPPPPPFISIHTRNFTTGEDLESYVVMQDRPKGEA